MNTRRLFDLTGKTALVTGGGRGIGRHIAVGLAEAGARVIVASRKLERCEAVVKEIEAGGGHASALRADVGKAEDVSALVDAALARAQRIDVLVNNAGIVWGAPTFDYPLDGWDKVFAVNVRGLWLLTQAIARHMAERGGGSIVNIASTSAFVGAEESEQPAVAYNASKGAVVALTTDLAVKLAAHGIRVNAIAPGLFDTDMMESLRRDPARLERFLTGVPARRPGAADDIKGAVVFLASDAAAYVTGQTLRVDGGMTCVLRA